MVRHSFFYQKVQHLPNSLKQGGVDKLFSRFPDLSLRLFSRKYHKQTNLLQNNETNRIDDSPVKHFLSHEPLHSI